MSKKILLIIDGLSELNPLTGSLALDAISVLKKTQPPVPFIEKVTKEAESEDCLRCNGQPFCRFLLACVYLEMGALETARLLVTEATEGFRIRDMNWNVGLCHWLEGEILLQEGNRDAAKRSWIKAAEKFDMLMNEFQMSSRYKRAEECRMYIKKIQKSIQKNS